MFFCTFHASGTTPDIHATKSEQERITFRGFGRTLLAFVVKILYLLHNITYRSERRLTCIRQSSSEIQVPPNTPTQIPAEAPKEDRVTLCHDRLQKLEIMFNEISSKSKDIPSEKNQILMECWGRIKSIENDLEKTKKVSLFCILFTVYLLLTFNTVKVFYLFLSNFYISCKYF